MASGQNPAKVADILNLRPPRCVKDIQKLTGCMAALSRYISRMGEKGLPFFKLLKAKENFKWTEEADQAFEKLKAYLASPSLLTVPKPDEELLLYIAATTNVVSTVLVVEREEEGKAYGVQQPIYYISEVLTESKQRYNQVQKFLYALLITKRKLLHYFQAFKITVVCDVPLGDILRNRDASGRIMKYALELSEFTLQFRSHRTIKS
jgi:hypothetical protein